MGCLAVGLRYGGDLHVGEFNPVDPIRKENKASIDLPSFHVYRRSNFVTQRPDVLRQDSPRNKVHFMIDYVNNGFYRLWTSPLLISPSCSSGCESFATLIS